VTVFFFTLIGYLSGSLPFSVWLTRWVLGVDVRRAGEDHNPGAANTFKAAGRSKWWLGLTVLLLDGFKGLIPVAIAFYNFNITGWAMVPVALSPIVGHAYSIFLKFRGGKAVATSFGVWTALTVYQAPLVLGGFFIIFTLILTSSGWAVILGMLGLLGYLMLVHSPGWILAIWAGNMLVFMLKHWTELQSPPSLKRKKLNP